jgi:hypothetical protein
MSVLLYLTFDLRNLVYFIVQDQPSCSLSLSPLVILSLSLCSKDVVSLREYLP